MMLSLPDIVMSHLRIDGQYRRQLETGRIMA